MVCLYLLLKLFINFFQEDLLKIYVSYKDPIIDFCN